MKIFLYSLILFSILISGCAKSVKIPNVVRKNSVNPNIHWHRVLKNYVNKKGEVDFHGLSQNPDDLYIFVNFISQVSPESNPQLFLTRESKIAFYINSYNALSIYNRLDSDIPETLAGLRKVKFFFLKKFTIGGKKMSLYTYENKVIRKHGEERVHFALNCMTIGCPRLPQAPFTPDKLNDQLEHEAKRFFEESRNVLIDHKSQTLRLSEIMKFYKKDFLLHSSSLISYVNKYRKEKIPENYKMKFIDYDWTVNAQGEE